MTKTDESLGGIKQPYQFSVLVITGWIKEHTSLVSAYGIQTESYIFKRVLESFAGSSKAMPAGSCLSLRGGGTSGFLSLSLWTRTWHCRERRFFGQLQVFRFCKPLFPVLFSIYTSYSVLRKHWWFGVLVVSGSIFIYKESLSSRWVFVVETNCTLRFL